MPCFMHLTSLRTVNAICDWSINFELPKLGSGSSVTEFVYFLFVFPTDFEFLSKANCIYN